jgi:hypothetical protein
VHCKPLFRGCWRPQAVSTRNGVAVALDSNHHHLIEKTLPGFRSDNHSHALHIDPRVVQRRAAAAGAAGDDDVAVD